MWKTPARMWKPRSRSPVARGTADDPHRLPAVAWDLQLTQPGHAELGPALAADEEDVKPLDVFDLVLLLRARA